MAFVRFEDQSGSVELVVFPDVFSIAETQLKQEGALLVSGQLEKDDNEVKILVETIRPVQDLFKRVKKVTVALTPDRQSTVKRLREAFEKHPGETAVELRLVLPDLHKTVELELKDLRGVQPGDRLFEDVFRVIENRAA